MMDEGRDSMADIFNNLGNFAKDVWKKAEVVTETVTQKTEEAIEVQKIKSQIRVMERSNDNDYKTIGKIIFDRYKNGEVVDPAFIDLCETMEERETTIHQYKKEIAAMKGQDVCPKCKAHIDDDAVFCPKCGEKISRSIFEDEE